MNNVALRTGVVTGLYGNSGAASQQTGILGEDTARRMRVRGIPLARQPEEDALRVDATDVLPALDASGFRAGNPRFQGEAGDASHAIAGTVREVALVPVPGIRHPRSLEGQRGRVRLAPRCRAPGSTLWPAW